MVSTETPHFKRVPVNRHDRPVPLAFVFDSAPRQPEHFVTLVSWTVHAIPLLRDLSRRFEARKPRRSLPVQALRGRLEVCDQENLRLDWGLGLKSWNGAPTILWSAAPPTEACQRARSAALGWLIDDVRCDDPEDEALVQALRRLARDGNLVEATQRSAQVFDWGQTRSGTATVHAATNRNGYADLADFVVRRLEGKELLPGLGGLRRIVGGRLDANQAELMTEPILDQATPFSLLLQVRVLSFPGRPTPVVVLEMSRRLWSRRLKKTATRELSAYALPTNTRTALRFTLQRQALKADGKASSGARNGHKGRGNTAKPHVTYSYQPGGDYAPIARAYGLPLELTADQMAAAGQTLPGCRLFVVHKHGVGERTEAKQGVPDLDKMTAFRRMEAELAPYGLRPWQALEEIPTKPKLHPVRGRDQHWQISEDEDEERRAAFEQWQTQAIVDLARIYQGAHHLVIAYHPICYADALQARDLLQKRLVSQIRMQLIQMPSDVHGPRSALPRPVGEKPQNRDYAEIRARAWEPFISEVRRYQDESAAPIDGILAIAPEWYGQDGDTRHDDPVNKRAGRITLATALQVPVQYLRPEREESQTFHPRQDPAESFELRAMMAWLSLAWKTIGGIKPEELAEQLHSLYGSDPDSTMHAATHDVAMRGEDMVSPHPPASRISVSPPDRVLAVGILRRNRTRVANERSFVPFAIELDMEQGVCSARFVRDRGPGYEITPLRPLVAVLAELAESGPIQLVTTSRAASTAGEIRQQRKERTEHFFHTAITDFCQRAKHPLVLIDAVACREVWPWVADAKLDPQNVLLAEHPHAEADWGDVRIVRIRTGNAPKVLFDRYFKGTSAETTEEICYDAPKWAEAQLFRLTDSRAAVFFSFGSLLRKGRVLGSSCYRTIEGLHKEKGKGAPYTRKTFDRWTQAWSTPRAVELTVVRTARGESPAQLAQLVMWLSTLYQHIGDWTTKPAPLFFETALKEYLADYDLDESEEDQDQQGDDMQESE